MPDRAGQHMPPWHEEFGGPLRADQVSSLAAFVMNWKATAG
jgi:hypothetical protein